METSIVTHRHLKLSAVGLHLAEAGPEAGPLLVLLHGFPESWWGWRRQIGPLAEAGFRVVAPDQRGYGLSAKPEGIGSYDLDTLATDVAGLVEALGRERAVLVGHDWGGLVAWWTATRRPERVERLVILNAPHPAIAGPYARRHLSQALRSAYVGYFQLPFLPEASLKAFDFALLRRSLTTTSRPGAFSADDIERYAQGWRAPGALTGMLNWYRALRSRPQLPDGARVAAPTRVLWGTRDRFLERGLAEASAALCREASIRWFEEATHWLHLEEVEQVNQEIATFAKG